MTAPDEAATGPNVALRTVGQVARLSGVSIRTLHHYDDIGLLTPSERSGAGYRLYSPKDLIRLQEILVLRNVGIPLAEVAELVGRGADGGGDDAEARRSRLARQRGVVSARIARDTSTLQGLDRLLSDIEEGTTMTEEERFAHLRDVDEFADEAHERWGTTEAYRESARRTDGFGPADWERVKAEQTQQAEAFGRLFAAGIPAHDDRAMAAAEAARRFIDSTFYPLSSEAHRELAVMYVEDSRFTAYYDAVIPGLAQYVHDAIHANADRTAATEGA